MLYDGIELIEGSSIENASISTGMAFPPLPTTGELFYRSDEEAMYVYNGTVWGQLGAGGGGAGFDAAANQTVTGTWSFTNAVSGGTPTITTHLTTKEYVDTLVQGLTWKTAVRAATTADVVLSGAQTIDGVSLVVGNRVLVKNQTTASQNGVYVVAIGSWSRAVDMDGSPDAGETNGAAVYVTDGTANADTTWTQTAIISTVGVEAMVFAQLGGGVVNAANLTGSSLAPNVVTSSLTTVGTITEGTWQGGAIASGYGGTGLNSYVTGDIIFASSTNLLAKRAVGLEGQVFTVVGGVPNWADAAASSGGGTTLPRVTEINSEANGKRVVVTASQTIPATTWQGGGAISAGDIFSVYNASSFAITLTAGAGLTMYREANASAVGSVTLAARGSATIWYNTASEVLVSGSIT